MYTVTKVDKRTAVIFASVVTFIMGSMIFIAGASSNILPAIICGSLLAILSIVVLGYVVWTHVSEEPVSTPLIRN
ncbi:MAG: hypothetical protein EBU33_02345 [Sphingobacteriia bacterium]|nr:hypothetical protein [Sphingobacteriia bacterium]